MPCCNLGCREHQATIKLVTIHSCFDEHGGAPSFRLEHLPACRSSTVNAVRSASGIQSPHASVPASSAFPWSAQFVTGVGCKLCARWTGATCCAAVCKRKCPRVPEVSRRLQTLPHDHPVSNDQNCLIAVPENPAVSRVSLEWIGLENVLPGEHSAA